MAESKKTNPIVYVILAGLVAFGLYTGITRFQKLSSVGDMTSTASGTVSRVSKHYHSDDHSGYDEYAYTVTFEDSDHIEHTAESVARTKNRKTHAEGDSVEVRYDPRNADYACIIVGDEGIADRARSGTIVGVAIGAVMIGAAVFMKVSLARKRDKAFADAKAKAEAELAAGGEAEPEAAGDGTEAPEGRTARLDDDGE